MVLLEKKVRNPLRKKVIISQEKSELIREKSCNISCNICIVIVVTLFCSNLVIFQEKCDILKNVILRGKSQR